MSVNIFFILLLCICSQFVFAQRRILQRRPPKPKEPLSSLVEWKQLDFDFPNKNERDIAVKEKRFISTNCIPFDADVDYTGSKETRIFVTIPRVTLGIPVTLGTVSKKNSPNGPLITPYPNYGWHKSYGKDCNGITSVFRVMIDDCKRLWVLDTGKIGKSWKCSPQLLIFDLRNDKLLHRYKIPKNQYKSDSLFGNLVVDVKDDCKNNKAYLADVKGHGIVVYDSFSDQSWRIENRLFKNTPGLEKITVARESLLLTDGILGMALANRKRLFEKQLDSRHLFFHSVNAITENSVPLKVLNDGTTFTRQANAYSDQFKVLGGRGIQSVAQAMDSRGNLFFGVMEPTAVACWDSTLPYTKQNIKLVAKNSNTLQFAMGMKVIRNFLEDEELWVVTNRFQKTYAGTGSMNFSEVNFRILMRPIKELFKGKKCDGQPFV